MDWITMKTPWSGERKKNRCDTLGKNEQKRTNLGPRGYRKQGQMASKNRQNLKGKKKGNINVTIGGKKEALHHLF